ncbi:MAG: hypothetical protein GY851_21500, partial [bacterium]|nr:hypothetical protein [bacterium]
QAIEDFDRNVVAPCLAHLRKGGPFRLMVVPDHVTAISTKTHAGGPVPFAVCGHGVGGAPVAGGEGKVGGYSERDAATTGVVLLEGHRLLPAVFHAAPFNADTLTDAPA